jgi:hypothetical protein
MVLWLECMSRLDDSQREALESRHLYGVGPKLS